MKPPGIRARILLIALAPAAVVAFLVSGLLIAGQIEQARIEQHRRLAAVARQIAAAAEYNIFVGNTSGLQNLLETTTGEPDIVGAAIFDPSGKVLASTLPSSALPRAHEVLTDLSPPDHLLASPHWHGISIRASNYGEQDLFSGLESPDPPLLGQLLIEITDEPLRREILRGVFAAAALALVVAVLGALLALALARRLTRLLLRISQVVDQVGHGISGVRIEYSGPDELGQLAQGIDRMIERVEISQAELARRIAEATQALRREKEEAEKAALSRSRFFAAASHDLRQPVQALGLFVAQLEREARNTSLEGRVAQLAQSVGNLQTLLDTLLDYSRLDGQVLRTDIRPVKLAAAIAAVVTGFSAAAAEKGLELRIRCRDCWVMSDPVLLHRVLLNLIGNAIRYTQHGGVLVACRRSAAHVRVCVWDTGPGIPPHQQDAIFEELVQLGNPERNADKGLGLGLAIVRRITDLLHHPLSLRSRLGRGSCFSLTLPLAGEKPTDKPTLGSIFVLAPPSARRDELSALLAHWNLPSQPLADEAEALGSINDLGIPGLLLCECDGRIETLLDTLDRLDAAAGMPLPALLVHGGPAGNIDLRSKRRRLLARPFRPARLRALLDHLLRSGNPA